MVWALLALAPLAQGQQKRAITFDDLIAMHRVGDLQISPDGKWVAFSVGTPDVEANRTVRNIWVVATSGAEPPRQLTRSGRDWQPRWSPDGKRIAFVSTRDGAPQIYLISTEGGEASKLTSISSGATEPTWSPDGKWLAFASEVYHDCRDAACNSQRDAEREKNKVKARVYDRLLYRHWDTWSEGKRSHVFIMSAEGPSASLGTSATPRDLLPGADYDVPVVQRGGPVHFTFSPDGKELCFNAVTETVEATTTNGDLFVVPAAGGEPKRITSNAGFDAGPVYSPDGKYIAYRMQERAGFEADRWQLVVYDRQSEKHISMTPGFDRSVESIVWSPDSRTVYFNAEEKAQNPIFSVSMSGGAPRAVAKDGYFGEFALSNDGRTLVYTKTNLTMPAEILAANADGSSARQLTRFNADRLAQLDLATGEHFWYEAAEGAQAHGILIRPPQFDATKKYPLLVLVHGGPQGAWSDAWGYRWNPQIFASPGYVVAMLNPRGTTGFGQRFTDEISGDWGGKVFTDLMKGVDYVLAKYPFADGTRMAAAGGSYGGYMMAWFASQSKGRFKALINHAGVYNLESMYGATEELWFPEWEFRGMPWTSEAMYEKWSPHKYAAEFGKYKTPMLVIHGEQDYRVPYTQGLEMFTALQRQGVPSKLVLFPDEGHWILKPQNSRFWYRTYLDWLAQWLK
jgi:dipeptidyl aminopeptidase/acylaminoacyl peptidase